MHDDNQSGAEGKGESGDCNERSKRESYARISDEKRRRDAAKERHYKHQPSLSTSLGRRGGNKTRIAPFFGAVLEPYDRPDASERGEGQRNLRPIRETERLVKQTGVS
jgi:hypothetical protein